MALRHLVAPGAFRHTTDANPLESFDEGEINIQADALWESIAENALRDLTDEGTQGLEVGIVPVVAKRKGHRGDILHTTLKNDAHRTTVMRVDRTVVAVIDAADDHIGPAGTEFGKGHLHTIDRCAVTTPHFDAGTLFLKRQGQRRGTGEGTGISAAGRIGGTDEDVAIVGEHLHKLANALSLIAIIVGNE